MKNLFLGLFIFTVVAPSGQLLTITELGGNAMVISNQSTGEELVVAKQRNGVILMPSQGRGDFLDTEKNSLDPLEHPNPFDLGE